MNTTSPLVSVICLCYNHRKFVKEALESVTRQTYKSIELIVVDDASTDGSKDVIAEFIQAHPKIDFIDIKENIGNCKAFNKALKKCKGEFIVDLAADDLMCTTRIEKQVHAFQRAGKQVGVVYSDAFYINEKGVKIGLHSEKYKPKTGEIYKELVANYFVAPPTMVMRRNVLESLGGYDENLLYEDFDFWVRSSRNYHYEYIDEPLTQIRKLSSSYSAKFYEKGLANSTYQVCKKVKILNNNEAEHSALAQRLKYELKHTALRGLKMETANFYSLLREVGDADIADWLWYQLSIAKIDLSGFLKYYRRLSSASSILK